MKRIGLVGCIFGVVCMLVMAQDSSPAVTVYGQPDFSSNGANRGSAAASAETLFYPLGITVDSSSGVYIADRNNHRVLYYANDGDSIADRVYGQYGDFTGHIANNNGSGNSGGANADNMTAPTGIALDSSGGLFVADRDNHRVLYFASDGNTTADRVYGQYGSFNVNMTNNDGGGNYGEPSAESFGTYILGAAVDSQDGLYISDATNHRVLYFANDGDTIADRVYGQWDDFTTGVRNNDGTGRIGAPSANSLNFPRGLAIDSDDGLYVSDRDNNRVLYFANDGDTIADRVYGQYDDFTMNAETNDGSGNVGQPNADNLSHPKSVTVDAAGGLYIADSLHHRVLYFAPDGDTTADGVMGQADSFTTSTVGAPSAENFNLPQGLAFFDGKLYVTDTGNDRALIFEIP